MDNKVHVFFFGEGYRFLSSYEIISREGTGVQKVVLVNPGHLDAPKKLFVDDYIPLMSNCTAKDENGKEYDIEIDEVNFKD